MSFLLDTNAVSEVRRKNPDAKVVRWFRQVDPSALYISVLTLGEIAKGAAMRATRDPTQASIFYDWLEIVRRNYADRTLDVDAAVAETWGRLAGERTLPVLDALLVATALVHNMTIVTRNVHNIAPAGVRIINPWTA